jgi:uncharacterized RDD family membrane protein YckC
MSGGDLYINSVIDHVPSGLPLREQIAMELRGHIAERMAQGQPLDEILRQLGDPEKLAESYLAAIPLKSASVGARFAAKIIDVLLVAATVCLALGVPALMFWPYLPDPGKYYLIPAAAFLCVIGFVAYTIEQEYRRGATVGKRMMGVRVVRESGARISLGQAMLRQLPFFIQIFFVDAIFALFTKHHQRAFELITKTRAVA